ncbi:MAG: signal peptidase II [Acidimicrobiia bacterium]|nr:signal peptidase II [Acidimicrobiia bacterium]
MRSDGGADPGGEARGPAIRDDDGGSRRARLTNVQLAFAVGAGVWAIDQLTKWWATVALADGPIVLADGFLQFRLTYNTGAAFSMFSGGGPVLAVVAVGVVVMILWVVNDASRRAEAVALGMVLGGAVGNLTDRIVRGDGFLDGAVVDFIDFSFFATFNVADMGITLGVGLLLLVAFLPKSAS